MTSHAGHARELVSSEPDLGRWRALVAVSGDGLVNEIYSALYKRQREEMGKLENAPLMTPVGLLPGGSGCALNCSLLRYC